MKEDISRIKFTKNSKLLFPIFCELANFTDDTYWKNEFTKMSAGKFPVGIIYRNEYLNYRIKKKVYELHVNNSSDKTFKEVKDFIIKYGGIFSTKDMEIKNSEQREQTESHVNIKKETDLDIHLKKFIKDFPKEKADAYWYLVRLGVEMGFLNSKDFVFNDDNITEIKGIEQEGLYYQIERSRIYKCVKRDNEPFCDILSKNKKKGKTETIDTQTLHWNKYLKNLEKWKETLFI